MNKVLGYGMWVGVSVLAALRPGRASRSQRGEPVNSIWLVTAAVCIYAIGYRFYAKFIAAQGDDARRPSARRRPSACATATTSSRPTSGSSSAITSRPSPGPGRWSGPTLAAQFGYLPGTLWIIIGAVLGGARAGLRHSVRSMRRDGKSLGQMAREEIGQARRLHRAGDRAADHDHPAGGGRAGGRERAARTARGAHSRSPRRCRSRSSWASICATGGPARCWKSRSSASCWCC